MSGDIWAEPLKASDLSKRIRNLHQRLKQLEAPKAEKGRAMGKLLEHSSNGWDTVEAIRDLQRRVVQIEEAVVALASGVTIARDENGVHAVAPQHWWGGPRCHPSAHWKYSVNGFMDETVCSVCGGPGR